MSSLTLLAHGDAVPIGRLASAWTADALPIAGAVVSTRDWFTNTDVLVTTDANGRLQQAIKVINAQR